MRNFSGWRGEENAPAYRITAQGNDPFGEPTDAVTSHRLGPGGRTGQVRPCCRILRKSSP